MYRKIKKKGQQYLTTAFVITAFLVFLVLFPSIKSATLEAVRKSAAFQAEQMASIINLLQASPENTYKEMLLLKGKCNIEINRLYVSYEVEKDSFKSDIIQTQANIPTRKLTCSESIERRICFVKRNDMIDIFEPINDCVRR